MICYYEWMILHCASTIEVVVYQHNFMENLNDIWINILRNERWMLYHIILFLAYTSWSESLTLSTSYNYWQNKLDRSPQLPEFWLQKLDKEVERKRLKLQNYSYAPNFLERAVTFKIVNFKR